ncbi:50S ribosomal protein L11 methyltransferase [Mucilaginibacter auburnensis]|uniref:Ribosomal protein L11 methyltransferase n=1 Tax=Mucilaginibacter auburnensis TaxID=1457233 RepID=A0A2H9VTU9_9SPHI|nr:50S ribosomal protein L11 methyltransferase [Mucilaginibacter auburnensis]PJJ84229.1 ribosomal protein L11 methyltransferase [Mucilaginibacter auburnensis]
MNYYELSFAVEDEDGYRRDLLINALGDMGFDTFEETENGFNAYIPVDNFNEEQLIAILNPFYDEFPLSYTVKLIEQQNWNEVWESNFEPISIGDEIYVRATFHQPRPEFKYEIVIDPKMAFGTGHHQTTAMVLQFILENDFAGKNVLDMGCGTGILAIMAAKLNAKHVTAIDYDPICYESTLENAALNAVNNITALCGSKEVIPDEQYDTILANINRNILLDQMERYAEVLKPGGEIYFSGFYETPDLEIITKAAGQYGLKYIAHKKDKDWVAAKFIK